MQMNLICVIYIWLEIYYPWNTYMYINLERDSINILFLYFVKRFSLKFQFS